MPLLSNNFHLPSLFALVPNQFKGARSLLVCLHVFRVTKFKLPSVACSFILSHHYAVHPLQSYPFTVRVVPQADTQIAV